MPTKHSKMLEVSTQLHGNGSSLLNFTQFHSTCFSLGLNPHPLQVVCSYYSQRTTKKRTDVVVVLRCPGLAESSQRLQLQLTGAKSPIAASDSPRDSAPNHRRYVKTPPVPKLSRKTFHVISAPTISNPSPGGYELCIKVCPIFYLAIK